MTSNKNIERDSVIALSLNDPLVGFVICDDLNQLGREEILREGGAMTLKTMMAVAGGLRAALAI